jgi:hypothetical protein
MMPNLKYTAKKQRPSAEEEPPGDECPPPVEVDGQMRLPCPEEGCPKNFARRSDLKIHLAGKHDLTLQKLGKGRYAVVRASLPEIAKAVARHQTPAAHRDGGSTPARTPSGNRTPAAERPPQIVAPSGTSSRKPKRSETSLSPASSQTSKRSNLVEEMTGIMALEAAPGKEVSSKALAAAVATLASTAAHGATSIPDDQSSIEDRAPVRSIGRANMMTAIRRNTDCPSAATRSSQLTQLPQEKPIVNKAQSERVATPHFVIPKLTGRPIGSPAPVAKTSFPDFSMLPTKEKKVGGVVLGPSWADSGLLNLSPISAEEQILRMQEVERRQAEEQRQRLEAVERLKKEARVRRQEEAERLKPPVHRVGRTGLEEKVVAESNQPAEFATLVLQHLGNLANAVNITATTVATTVTMTSTTSGVGTAISSPTPASRPVGSNPGSPVEVRSPRPRLSENKVPEDPPVLIVPASKTPTAAADSVRATPRNNVTAPVDTVVPNQRNGADTVDLTEKEDGELESDEEPDDLPQDPGTPPAVTASLSHTSWASTSSLGEMEQRLVMLTESLRKQKEEAGEVESDEEVLVASAAVPVVSLVGRKKVDLVGEVDDVGDDRRAGSSTGRKVGRSSGRKSRAAGSRKVRESGSEGVAVPASLEASQSQASGYRPMTREDDTRLLQYVEGLKRTWVYSEEMPKMERCFPDIRPSDLARQTSLILQAWFDYRLINGHDLPKDEGEKHDGYMARHTSDCLYHWKLRGGLQDWSGAE